MSLIEVEDLSITYGSARRRAAPVVGLDRVSLRVEAGETLGIVGESGSGKSTLGRAIAGLESISSGSVRVAGFDVAGFRGRVPRAFWAAVQMVWQDPLGSLTPTMKIRDLLAEATRHGGQLAAVQVSQRLRELMDMVQLPQGVLDRHPHELSGGQRQRVAIARAFAARPSVVVLDEAVSALDVLTQGQILQLLNEIQQELGVTYLFISHDLGVVGNIADRTAVLYRGNLMEFGRTDQIVPEPAHPYAQELMRSTLSIDARTVENDPGVALGFPARSTGAAAPGTCPYLARCAHAIEACAERPAPTVELSPGHRVKCLLPAPGV